MSEDIRILHIDDELDFAETAATVLEQEDDALSVETTTNPTEAIELIDQHDFDCVIADYAMPEYDGVELLQVLREDYPDLPIIIYTGKGSEEVASAAIAEGATDYIRKRPDEIFDVLVDRVTETIEHHRARVNYEQIFESIPDGIVIHDPETFEFVDMNQKYADMFGYDSKEEFLEAGFEAIHRGEPPFTTENAREHVRKALENGPEAFEWPGVRKDGSEFWAEVHLTPVQLHGEQRILAAVRDVTDRIEYEKELEQKNERLDEFASIVSHDLRNPLSVAEGYLEMAAEKYDQDEAIQAIERAHTRMRNLIDDLLTLTRGETANEIQPVTLPEIADQCWNNVRIDSASIRIQTDRRFRADPSRLKQLLENLFRNAVDHAGEEPIITVGDLDNGIYVADDGPGIPEDERSAVFELGYTTSREGTGYGLSIVQEIVDEHGWEIDITESEASGARFEITGVEEAQ